MKKNSFHLLSLLLLTVFSCQPVLFDPQPKNTPEDNFEVLWKDFHDIYAAFEPRKVDWDSVYRAYKPMFAARNSATLFSTLSGMLAILKDAHVSLQTSSGEERYKVFKDGFPRNFLGVDFVKSTIIPGYKSNQSKTILYKLLPQNIGYIYILSFSDSNNEAEYTIIDQILQEFREAKGIIIDVRDNGGGSTRNAGIIANRFADQKRIGNYTRWKRSSAYNDMTDYDANYVKPEGPAQFTKTVIVLSNRDSFSATEFFIGLMKALPHVKQMGGASGGGSGIAYTRDLPNGWTFTIPRTLGYNHKKELVEKTGYVPDYPVTITQQDIENKFDRILQEAINLIL